MKNQSTFRMRPQTCIPGARLLKDNENNIVMEGGFRKRPAWEKPQPIGRVRHYKNEAVARKDKSGELIDLERDTINHPIYKGMDKSYYRYLRSQVRRSIRKQNEITEIVEDDNNISNSDSGQSVASGSEIDNAGVGVS